MSHPAEVLLISWRSAVAAARIDVPQMTIWTDYREMLFARRFVVVAVSA